MKKLLILFTLFLGLGTAEAQESKPTKEETVEYINNKFDKLVYRSSNSVAADQIDYLNTKFDGCNFIVKMSFKRVIGKNEYCVETNDSFEIPIDKMEKVEIIESGLRLMSHRNAKLVKQIRVGTSKDSNGTSEKIDENEILSAGYLPMYQSDADELVKAFNHLRKLCGAPEPISFD
ncbi:hypothetical protein [Sphingobacterium suaedae]|uniref:DUF4468 domain-containing protein n=1 Tax=Sphingobacterium suaedae TaxID=1686402 RepID=A0ABW5KLF0_9SPHI